jgi:hypothetical protein
VAHVDELHPEVARLADGLRRESRTDATIRIGGVNDDGLEFRIVTFYEKAAETGELTLQCGDPQLREPWARHT